MSGDQIVRFSVDGGRKFSPVMRPACFIRHARARYWRIARGYFGLGVALGVSIGMVLGALAVRP